MECDDADNSGVVNQTIPEEDGRSAVNSTILDYYKKFGRKRDLEQFFSLSTAQSEIRDPSSVFWRRMKSQNDSSDSGEKSSMELCRISIKCSVSEQEPSSSQDYEPKTKSDSESPPIITEEAPLDISKHTDDESAKSDDNHSQKSVDGTFDTSINKPLSPSSSITSQRKLEWDSLADVGYANESDRKNSASSLSTLERLALKQQYSNNDTTNHNIGPPTSHSTPLDENETKSKGKKGSGKVTKVYRRDIDCVEVNMPHSSEINPSQAISVNLTKHISFNVERDGLVTVDNIKKDISVTPEKVSVETEVTPQVKLDKEIQTTLTKTKDKYSSSVDIPMTSSQYGQVPVLINLNTLKKRNRRKKIRTAKKRIKSQKKLDADKENLPILEKTGGQVSEAESFEYMPGHIYNQNHMKDDRSRPNNTAGNKSSLESSGNLTSDSSKATKHSFSKDLNKSINLLKTAFEKRYEDSNLKKKLIKEIVERLLKANYRDEDSTTDFLSGLSFNSKKLGLGESTQTTTSTSDANNTDHKDKLVRPKKSILRVDKFNPNALASTSQSAPNLPSVSNSEKPVTCNLAKPLISSNTESDISSKGKNSSDTTAFAKTSSEELYQKYVEALRREEAYKKHLRDKEMFLKQKLVSSETAFKIPSRIDVKSQNRIIDLMKDLTRNNYDDGSGDASKLEGGSNSNLDFVRNKVFSNQRSHSVFTLSSGNSDCQNRKSYMRRSETKEFPKAGCSKEDEHYCCCPFHLKHTKIGVTDSSVQVNFNTQPKGERRLENLKEVTATCDNRVCVETHKNIARVVSDNKTGDIKYVCLCNKNVGDLPEITDNFLIYKCSRLTNMGIQSQRMPCDEANDQLPSTSKGLEINSTQKYLRSKNYVDDNSELQKTSKCSQTNLALQLRCNSNENIKQTVFIHEATRCIQTEISINPKISDPSLSDINIINDADCAKLISEQYREVSKSSSNSDNIQDQKIQMLRTGSEMSVPSVSDTCIKNDNLRGSLNEQKLNEMFDKEIQSDIEDAKDVRYQINKQDSNNIQDNFTIPIQGTNMTLMVRIGSNAPKSPVELLRNEVTSQAIVTDAVNTVENATSLSEECTKGVQSQKASIFSQTELEPLATQNKSNKKSIATEQPCLVNTLFTRQGISHNIKTTINQAKDLYNNDPVNLDKGCGVQTDLLDNFYTEQSIISKEAISEQNKNKKNPRYNTYPKVQFNDQKLLLRRGTDTGNLEIECSIPHEDTQPHVSSCFKSSLKQSTCGCPETSKCGGSCGETSNCRKPQVHTSTDTRKKESLRLKDVEGDRKQETKPSVASQYKDQTPENKLTCGCPLTSKCKGSCGENSECAKNPLFRSNNQIQKNENSKLKGAINVGIDTNEPKMIDQSVESSCFDTSLKKIKCGCLESAKCRGMCNENADCLKQALRTTSIGAESLKSKNIVGNNYNLECTIPSQSKPEQSIKSIENSCVKSSLKRPKCGCPTTSECEGSCGENATCAMKSYVRSNNGSGGKETRKPFIRSNTDTFFILPEHKGIDYPLSTNILNEKSLNNNYKKPLLRSNTDTGNLEQVDWSLNRGNNSKASKENVQNKPKCGCPVSSNCDGNCEDDASCSKGRFIQSESYPDSQSKASKDTLTEHSSSDNNNSSANGISSKRFLRSLSDVDHVAKDSSNQTEYVDVKNTETQRGYITDRSQSEKSKSSSQKSSVNSSAENKFKSTSDESVPESKKTSVSEAAGESSTSKDMILDMIQDITRRYSKNDIEKSQRKKCFKEIMTILNYLLDTDDSTDTEKIKALESLRDINSDCTSRRKSREREILHTNVNIGGATKKVPVKKDSCGTCQGYKQVETSTSKDTERGSAIKSSQESCKTKTTQSSTTETDCVCGTTSQEKVPTACRSCHKKTFVDKAVQLSTKKSKSGRVCNTESSEIPISTECHGTSSDSATCKVLNKIRKECEKYHQKRCKCHNSKKCEASSSTSVNCDTCKRIHHCSCRGHKCKGYRPKSAMEKVRKKCVAYNLIIQTSESMISEETTYDRTCRPMQSIIVKVPPKRKPVEDMTFKELSAKIERRLPSSPKSECRGPRSRSLPNESGISSTDDCVRKNQVYTVRDYLEKNRPDFVEQCSRRQNCLRMISESRTSERASYRELLSLQLQMGEQKLNEISEADLRRLARELGSDLRRKKVPPKLISEREMKKYSEKIYKSLPEVTQKKEEIRKENIKKTNLLMANIFKKNLQKKTLRGSVNLSNYNTILKI